MKEEYKTKLKAILAIYTKRNFVENVNGVPLDELILTLEKVQEYFYNLEHDIKITDRNGLEDVFNKSRKLKLKGISTSLLQIITSLKNVNDYSSLYKSLTYLRNNDTEDFKKNKTEVLEYLIDAVSLADLLHSVFLGEKNE